MTIDRQTRVIDYIGDDHGGTAPSYYTAIQFHRWIGGLAATATSSGDDELDVTDQLPSTRATDNFITLINGYSVTAAFLEHFYDGSLVWDGGNEIADGFVNFGNEGVMLQIQQNGAILTDDFWNFSVGGTCTAGSSGQTLEDSGETWTTDQWVGYVVENTTDGSQGVVTSNTADTITVDQLRGGSANVFANTNTFQISKGLNASAAAGISHRFAIMTRTGGADIDNRVLFGQSRTYTRTFSEFKINGTARGNNVFAISDADDLNNNTAHATVEAYSDVHIVRTDSTANASGTNSAGQNILNVGVGEGTNFAQGDFIMTDADSHEYKIVSISTDALTLNRNLVNAVSASENVWDLSIGFTQADVDNDTTDEDYYAYWTKGAQSINGFFEYTKLLSADYTDHYIYGLPGDLFRGITHEIALTGTVTGTFDLVEGVSWTAGTGGAVGTGQMLAIEARTGSPTKLWVQLLTGGTPGTTATVTGDTSGATISTHGSTTPVDRSSLLTQPYSGASTGSAIIGSYGFTLLTPTDLGPSDKIFDLTNTLNPPPNSVQFDVTDLDITGGEEDYVNVYTYFGDTDINGDPLGGMYRWKLNAAITTDNITTVQIDQTIPTSVPATGYIQIIDDNGVTRKLAYTSHATDTFSGISPAEGTTDDDFSSVNATPTANSYKGDVLQGEYMLDTALEADNETAIVIDGTIATDTPTTNFPLRVQDDNGFMRLLNCASRTGSTFTVDNTDGQEDFLSVNSSLGSIVYIGYLDQTAVTATESFDYIYGATSRNFVIKVRNGGVDPIKEYIATGTMGTSGGSIGAIRTPDE
jgi:hypothetical protein